MFPLRDEIPSRRAPLVTWALIAANVAIFLWQLTLPEAGVTELFYLFGIVPARFTDPAWAAALGFPGAGALPFVTSMFLHGGFLHLISNLWTLWIFGDNVEDRMGRFRFVVFYLACGLAAGWVHWITNPTSTVPTVGASGARRAALVAANRSRDDLTLNRSPRIAAHGDPALFLRALAERTPAGPARTDWLRTLRARDVDREAEIARQAAERPATGLNPLHLLGELDRFLDSSALLVADGGDFVGTASYVVRSRRPLAWLDPGAFGTLGVGGGFAMGAKLALPDAEVWILYGDGSLAWGLAEFEAYARQQVGVIALVGNDASWGQIARDQIPVLGDDVATTLSAARYEDAAAGLGGRGLRIERVEEIAPAFEQARAWARDGVPVLLNAILAKSEFRKGSISL